MTDRGVNFESFLFKHLCAITGADKVRTTSFHPKAIGGAERLVRSIKPSLAKFIYVDQQDWDVYLSMAISAYNNSYNSCIRHATF